jgi:hypothetical protein
MRCSILALSTLLFPLAACSGDAAEGPAEVAQGAESYAGTPAPEELGAAQAPGGPSAPTASAIAAPKGVEPKVVPSKGSRPAMLDTGVDLSKVKDPSISGSGAGFPSQQVVPTVPEAAPSVPLGPPGAVALVEGEMETHFGELLEGDKVSKTFRLKSAGENPLVIERVKPSCGCTATELQILGADGTKTVYEYGQPIPVGAEFELEASINTANRRGPFSSSVSVYSNDPESPLRLTLGAEVKAVLNIEPMSLDFGAMTSADSKEGVFTISTTVLEPYKLTLDPAQIIEPLGATLKAVEPDAEGRSKTWELAVKLGPGAAEGPRRYPLRILTDVPQTAEAHAGHEGEEHAKAMRELNCTVSAQVTGLVVATPNFISLGVVRPGDALERMVKIESLDPAFELPAAPAYRLLGLNGSEAFAYAEHFKVAIAPTPGAEGKSLDVTMRLEGMPADANLSFGGMLQIDIGHPTKPQVNVRFSGLARPGAPAAPAGAGTTPSPADGASGANPPGGSENPAAKDG